MESPSLPATTAYRKATPRAEPSLRPEGRSPPRSLVESWFGDFVNLRPDGGYPVIYPGIVFIHVMMSILTLGPATALAIWQGPALLEGTYEFDTEGVFTLVWCGALALTFAGAFGLTWHVWLRGFRAVQHINSGRLDEAERALGGARFAKWQGSQRGLIAALRGDHESAVKAYLGFFKHFDMTSLYGAAHATRQISSYDGQRATQNVALAQAMFEGVQAQARARAAIASINLGRIPEAEALLGEMPRRGEYLTALALVATGYLHLAKGEPMPPERVDALERTFAPVRGAWGGLALAAYGRERLGDAGRCAALVAEENARVHAARLLPALPLLARWAEDGRARRATA